MHGPLAFTHSTSQASRVFSVITTVVATGPQISCVAAASITDAFWMSAGVARSRDIGVTASLQLRAARAITSAPLTAKRQSCIAFLIAASKMGEANMCFPGFWVKARSLIDTKAPPRERRRRLSTWDVEAHERRGGRRRRGPGAHTRDLSRPARGSPRGLDARHGGTGHLEAVRYRRSPHPRGAHRLDSARTDHPRAGRQPSLRAIRPLRPVPRESGQAPRRPAG